MKFTWGLCFLLGFASDFITAAALEGKTTKTTEISQSLKAVRANGDGGQTNNMTVAFVPLISIIANLLPRFFGRYSTVTPPGTVQQARAFMYQKRGKAKCNEPWHVGKRWENPFNKSLYFECYYSEKCFPANKESCYEVKIQKCQFPNEFHVEKKLCLFDMNPKIPYKHIQSIYDLHNNFT